MARIKPWLAPVVAVAALAVGVPHGMAARAQPVARAACTHAVIGGQSKCIARGQYCARRYQRQYLRYGLSCSKLDANGRYHLR
jgi:hypothetical protein